MRTVILRLRSYGVWKLSVSVLRWFWVMILRRLDVKYVERKVHGYRLILDLNDDGLSKQLLKYGTRELDHKYILDTHVRPGSLIVDIGANIGYYAIMESMLVGARGHIVAVEPSPSNVDLLKKNIDRNGVGNISVIPGAISSTTGTKEFYLSNESNLNTFHNYGTVVKHLSGRSIDVPTYTVSDLLKDVHTRIGGRNLDFIRMDVEGHEVDVLNGMLPEIRRREMRPSIIFETHLSRYGADNDMADVLNQMFSNGYYVKVAASSWQAGTKIIEQMGYSASRKIATDGVIRSMFENISSIDALRLICEVGGIRTVLLATDAQ